MLHKQLIASALLISSMGFTANASTEASNTTHAEQQQAESLEQLLEQIWQYELDQFPQLATSKGLQPSRMFTDISPSAMAERHAMFTQFLTRLHNVDREQLSQEQTISLLMQEYRLNNMIDLYTYQDHFAPITSEYGFHNGFGNVADRAIVNNQQSLDTYLQRLKAIPEQFNQHINYMREGIKVGLVQPKVVLKGFEDTVTAYIVDDLTTSRFYAPLLNMPDTLRSDKNMQQGLAATKAVNDAYQGFYDFLMQEYIPNAKENISVKTWPKGEAFYANRIKHYTTTDLSAEAIHQIGLNEVARIRAEMQTIIEQLEFDGDLNEFIHFLRTDPQFYAKTPEELIITASYIAKKMDAQLPKLFKKLPRTPYGVEPVPASIAPKYTTGRYISPRSDKDPGYYWVNTYALDKRPLYALPALTLHEAVPGHHLQISLAAEMQDLPEVRRSTYISAFGEGWGLYSEFLGVEVGIYDDPYDNFGRLSYEMWRACRLVVDTGMHMFGWSRDKALNYMLENTALSEHNVRTEIDRYISWPAQALSYKLGEIKIKELRAQAEDALGEHFDLRDFHDAVLAHGSVPLFVLEQNMALFIEKQKQKIK